MITEATISAQRAPAADIPSSISAVRLNLQRQDSGGMRITVAYAKLKVSIKNSQANAEDRLHDQHEGKSDGQSR